MEPVDPLIGSLLADRYRIDSLLGEGTMCLVYLGEHAVLRHKLAIKVLSPAACANEEAVRRFEREALAAANLSHPNLARAYDFGRAPDGRLFIVLEYVQGRTLDQVIATTRFDPWRAVRIATQILSGLAHAHASGVVHRDLKPANVVLVDTPDRGGTDLVKILDFGVAKLTGAAAGDGKSEFTMEGLVYGTPDYLSPEQAMGIAVDHRADLYSVGVVLYEMLVGRRPFVAADEVHMLLAHVETPPPPPSSFGLVPKPLEEVVLQLLAKSPADRYPDAQSVIEALDAAEAESSPSLVVVEPSDMEPASKAAPPAPAPVEPSMARKTQARASRRGGVGLALAVVAGAGAVLAGLWVAPYFTQDTASADATPVDAAPAASSAPSTAAPSTTPRTLEELESLIASHPADPALRREIAALHVKRRNLAGAVPQYREALRLDPSLKTDPVLQRHLVDALGSPFVWRQAANLLRDEVRESSLDALHKGAVEDARPRVRERSRQVLDELGMALPGWVEAAFAIEDASTCVERSTAIARAVEIGDRRLLGPLRRRQRTPPRTDRECDTEEMTNAVRSLADRPH